MSIVLPIGICIVAFLAYNQARFHDPLEIGSRYQLTGYDSRIAPLGRLSYVPQGADFYALTPPRPTVLFPFIRLKAPQGVDPPGLAHPEATGGLLAMAPIVIFIAMLPWLWRRRPALLGRLAPTFMLLALVGLVIPLLDSYQFFASTERYEVDFATLLVTGGLAGWLALSKASTGYRRWLLKAGGGLLAAWGCVAGFAISFYGSGPELAETHPGTWKALEEIGAPLSTAITAVVGHPMIGAITGGHEQLNSAIYTNLSNPVVSFSLSPGERAHLTVVSPYTGDGTLVAAIEVLPGNRYGMRVDGPGNTSHSYPLLGGGELEAPLKLHQGLNRVAVSPAAPAGGAPSGSLPVILVNNPSVSRRP
jgi:hypothetical protein